MGMMDIANTVGSSAKNLCNTSCQMGKNFLADPMKFITKDGLATSGRALKNVAGQALDRAEEGLDRFINDSVEINGQRVQQGSFVPVRQRGIEENIHNGSRNGSYVPNSFKQHACNLVAPGEKNRFGGSFELIG